MLAMPPAAGNPVSPGQHPLIGGGNHDAGMSGATALHEAPAATGRAEMRKRAPESTASKPSSSLTTTTTTTTTTGARLATAPQSSSSAAAEATDRDTRRGQANVALAKMAPHVGFRGLVSILVLLYHLGVFSDHPSEPLWRFSNAIAMPTFFLLSGYTLAVIYGSRPGTIAWGTFLQNRLARVYPLHIVASLICIPRDFYGYGGYQPTAGRTAQQLFNTVVPVSTWWPFQPAAAFVGFNSSAWTISTLLFFYAVFPWLLPGLQRVRPANLARRIVQLFYVQMAVYPLVILVLVLAGGRLRSQAGCHDGDGASTSWWAYTILYWTATANGPSRLPVFVMGCLAGLHQTKCPNDDGFGWLGLFGTSATAITSGAEGHARRADAATAGVVLLALGPPLLGNADDISAPLVGTVGFYGQLLLPYFILQLVSDLTRDGGKSYASRFFTTPIMLYLGRISMAVYLVHCPIVGLTTLAINGPLQWPELAFSNGTLAPSEPHGCDDFWVPSYPGHPMWNDEWRAFFQARLLPSWAIPAVVVATVVAGAGLERFVERPVRGYLQAAKTAATKKQV